MKTRLFALLFNFTVSLCFASLAPSAAQATVYEVGPGKAYANIGNVPWESLQPGDTVLIYWRATPYKEKWVICRQGTAAAPILVRGMPGADGSLPVIDGNGATTRTTLNYWNENRGVIKIGGANVPADTTPRYITLENLDIRSARTPYTYTAANGTTQSYTDNASSIYVEKGENITVRNCIIHDSGNGFFVASSDALASRDILVESNYIYDNGIANSIFQHNNYTAAIGITFQYNRFGPPRAGCPGNNLKDRSAGLVVRYNWIEGGNRQLDLVDGEDSALIRNDPRYRETHVYGNILIEPDAAGNRQITHYGGDSGTTANYRKGTLYFYNNTVVSTRTDRTTLFRLSTNSERCDARNNIFYVTAAGNTLSLVDADGVLDLMRNWFKPGYVATFGTLTGTINDNNTSVTGTAPGFVNEAGQDFRLASGSACVNAGIALNAAVLPANEVARQYVKHQGNEVRPNNGQRDLGAFELLAGPPSGDVMVQSDYDGDGKNDYAVWRPSDGVWYIIRSSSGLAMVQQWGSPGDVPVPGDYDNDGKTDFAVWRPSNGTWYIIRSASWTVAVQHFGAQGDVPVPGDYDGDGRNDYAVWRPSDGVWYVIRSASGTVMMQPWSSPGDVPVPGDYDGDGKTDIAVWRPSNGTWYVIRSASWTAVAQQWGGQGDVPVPSDYDNDGKTDFAIWRPSSGVWYVILSANWTGAGQQWGSPGDVPVPGDYDGDGKTDFAIWRPSNGVWYVIRSASWTVAVQQWGQPR